MARTATTLLLLCLALAPAAGCKRSSPPPAPPPAPPSYDQRELPALEGAGREIPDGGPAVDSGVHVSDTTAALYDEQLCLEACAHLYEILMDEQRGVMVEDPDGLAIFEEELARIRPQRERKCVRQCRKYADRRAIDCVKAATKREQLDRCDF